jgi:hypothetical protein
MRSLFYHFILLIVSSVSMVNPVFAQAEAAANNMPTATIAAMPARDAVSGMVVPDAPYGTCPIDMQQQADNAAIKYMHLGVQGGAKLRGVYGECVQLEALRANSSKIAFLNSYVTLVEQDGNSVNFNRSSTILTLASSVGLTSAFSSAATQSLKSGFGARPPSYHGILKQTPDFLIVGAEQRHVVKEREFAVAAVSLITVINGKIVTANFFQALSGNDSFAMLAQRAEVYGNTLLAANP